MLGIEPMPSDGSGTMGQGWHNQRIIQRQFLGMTTTGVQHIGNTNGNIGSAAFGPQLKKGNVFLS
jgi:hypothetical protein